MVDPKHALGRRSKKSVVYRAKREYVRPSRCLRGDGKPKYAFADQATAEDARDGLRERARRRPDDIEVYECSCGSWHLGNRRVAVGDRNRRVVDRLPCLLIELGERVSAQMLAESSWKAGTRMRAIRQRLPLRRQVPASGSGPFVCDVAGCEQAFPTMDEVVAHERLHDAWRTR